MIQDNISTVHDECVVVREALVSLDLLQPFFSFMKIQKLVY